MRALLPPLVLATCALLGEPLQADTASSLRTLDQCLAKLPTAAPAKVDELRLACPDIEQAIIDSGLSRQLPEHWQRRLDRSSVEDISALLHRYQSPLPSAAPGVATLYQVRQTLQPSEPPHGWWQDFKAWLRRWLASPESGDSSWLSRWLSRVTLPQLLLQSLVYGLIGVILVVAAWIVWREITLARAGERAASGAPRPAAPPPADATALSLDEVERASPRDQPALLLRLLVQALLQSGRLVNDRPLTHRELAARSGIDDAGQHERFERISLLAERLLYGPAISVDGTLAPVSLALADGRDLYAQWTRRRAPAA